jgi:hypothetical protein
MSVLPSRNDAPLSSGAVDYNSIAAASQPKEEI